MIDFIKIKIQDLPPIRLEAKLEFFDTINLTTGELKTTNREGNKVTPSKKASCNSLEFKIYDTGTIFLMGSLHRYWNHGAHNYNDFDINGVLGVLEDLKTKFSINTRQCILKCLEIGINIIPPIPTNEILDNCFLHKTKPFEYQKNSNEGRYKQVQHKQYIIKIYNKALHYKSKGFEIDGEIMRFEIKYIKMEKLNRKGIFSLQDLINYGLHNFKDDLLNEWQNVLFFDKTTRIDPLSTKLKNRLLEYSNQNYWTGLLSNNQIENFKYHKKQLRNITLKYSENLQNQITKIIEKKIDLLNTKTTQIDTLTIQSKQVVSGSQKDKAIKVCKVTGLNIEMQKTESGMLSHAGLKYYYQTDKKIFDQIKRRYMSKIWLLADSKTQIKEIAHNIRNRAGNKRRLHNPQQMNLFQIL